MNYICLDIKYNYILKVLNNSKLFYMFVLKKNRKSVVFIFDIKIIIRNE